MALIQFTRHPPLKLRLARDLVRSIKRGHPWVFAEALRHLPPAAPGSPATLLDNKKGREIARGFYDPTSPLALRICTIESNESLDEAWAQRRFELALTLRKSLFDQRTTAFRLFNGEGDGLPGLICDIYGDTAVIQLDGAGPKGFWNVHGIAEWVSERWRVRCVYEKYQTREQGTGRLLIGPAPTEAVAFLEHNVRFSADVLNSQKTGFFLDHRENRQRLRSWAEGRRVLNVFGYTGGFSVYAGLGGATEVTTVDLAAPALVMAEKHWRLNDLSTARHRTVTADAFEFLTKAVQRNESWDLVILDPPSFASAKAVVPQAIKAYQTLIANGAAVTTPNGLLAAASCSSHINEAAFLNACEVGISQARRRATLLGIYGQPPDHPTPLVFPEFRYLQFVLLRLA